MDEQLSQALSADEPQAVSLVRSPSFGGLLARGLRSSLSTAMSFTQRKDSEDVLLRLTTRVFHGVASGKRLEDFYELGEEIGKGAFGVVREAICCDTGTLFCCKSIPRENLTAEMFADIKLEAEIMMHLRGHRHVVEIMGLFEDDTHIHIVEEMCSGGDLYSKLTKTPVPYTEKEVAAIMRSVLTVLQHCHSMGVMYRDCKPDNFLLSSKGPDAILKATDFGISKFVKPGERLDDFCGTPTYMAPEVFDMSYSYPADVWSAGVMMYWVLCGDFPFKGRNKMELARKVYVEQPNMEGGVWDQVTPEAKELVKLMLQKDPRKRPMPADLLQHKWFKEMAGAKVKPLGNIVLQRMRAFTQMHDFKKEVMRHIAHHLDESYLVGLRSMFAAMDADSSGSLSTAEVLQALESQGCKIETSEVQALLSGIDDDRKGVINFQAFVSATISSSLLERKDLLQDAFQHYDRDGDGCISKGDLEETLRNSRVGNEKIGKILAAVDKNVDGQVDFAGFCDMMLESNDQGKDGFKLRWRIKKNEPGAIFSRRKSGLPNLASLGPRTSMTGVNSNMSKTACGLTHHTTSSSTVGNPHISLLKSAVGGISRGRSTSVAGFAAAELTASGSALSFSARFKRVSMSIVNGAKAPESNNSGNLASTDGGNVRSSTASSGQVEKSGGLKAMTRSVAASTLESSRLATFFLKISPFKMLAQAAPKSSGNIHGATDSSGHGSPRTSLHLFGSSDYNPGAISSAAATNVLPGPHHLRRCSIDPPGPGSDGRTSSPVRPPSSLKKTPMLAATLPTCASSGQLLHSILNTAGSESLSDATGVHQGGAEARSSVGRSVRQHKRISWNPVMLQSSSSGAEAAAAVAGFAAANNSTSSALTTATEDQRAEATECNMPQHEVTTTQASILNAGTDHETSLGTMFDLTPEPATSLDSAALLALDAGGVPTPNGLPLSNSRLLTQRVTLNDMIFCSSHLASSSPSPTDEQASASMLQLVRSSTAGGCTAGTQPLPILTASVGSNVDLQVQPAAVVDNAQPPMACHSGSLPLPTGNAGSFHAADGASSVPAADAPVPPPSHLAPVNTAFLTAAPAPYHGAAALKVTHQPLCCSGDSPFAGHSPVCVLDHQLSDTQPSPTNSSITRLSHTGAHYSSDSKHCQLQSSPGNRRSASGSLTRLGSSGTPPACPISHQRRSCSHATMLQDPPKVPRKLSMNLGTVIQDSGKLFQRLSPGRDPRTSAGAAQRGPALVTGRTSFSGRQHSLDMYASVGSTHRLAECNGPPEPEPLPRMATCFPLMSLLRGFSKS